MDNTTVAKILNEMAQIMELKEENRFKIIAFSNASRIIEGLSEDIKVLVEENRIKEVRGIGDHLAKIITDLVTQGTSKEYETMKKSIPEGVIYLLQIQGLGPKKVKLLYEKLKIKNVDELERACKNHELAKVTGFGTKTEENILKGITYLKKNVGKHFYPAARFEAEKLKAYLLQSKEVEKIEVAGSLRRKKEYIGDIDLLASAKNAKNVMDHFCQYPHIDRILAKGDTKGSIVLTTGINADLRLVKQNEFPYALHYFTGNKEHNTVIRGIAKDKGLKLNEYGLFKGTKNILCKTEATLFNKLGLDYIEPELRENQGEIEAAQKGTLPKNLVELKDLRGTFHNHTTESDGNASLEAMVEKAGTLGFDYLGISDHSQAAHYAHGLKPDRLKKQWKTIDLLNKKLKNFRILKGTEVDILSDGSLDYPDPILQQFDFVIASVHSKFKMTEKEMTQRITKALKNKYVTMIGHPTGRLLLSREAYPIDLFQLVQVASDYGKAMELNAHPRRLDIDWQICKFSKSKKVLVSINPDAHTTEGISDVQYGIGIARKGWLEKKDVLNTRSLSDILSFLKSYQ